jgi:xylobiose transport system substrate-binding protein
MWKAGNNAAAFTQKKEELNEETYLDCGDERHCSRARCRYFLVGCGKKKTGPLTLTVWARDLTDGTADHAYVTALVKDFQTKYPTITLDYVALGEGLNDKLKTAMAAGSGLPDVFQSWRGSLMGDFADAGMLLDLTSDLKAVDGLAKNADALLAKGIQPFAAGGKDKWPVLHLYMYLVDRFGGPNAFPDAVARKTHFYGDAQQLMATGKAGMHVTGSWMCANYADPKFTKEKIGFYGFPEMTGGVGPAADVMGMMDIGFAATKAAADFGPAGSF